MTYILFDIGGTKTRVTASDDLQSFGDVKSFKTPMNFSEGVKKIAEAVDALKVKKVKAFAGGIRGLLMEDKSGIENDGVLSEWARKSIAKELQKYYKAPLHLENDTAVAGLGEAIFGGGKGHDIVVYHTISTGVGGVKIEYGEIDQGSMGFEPGHQILDIDRTVLGTDVTPTLENLVSGAGLEARVGVPPKEIPQEDMIWDELAEYLAQGLRNSIMYWSPDVIVLGGSMILGDPRISIDRVRKHTVDVLDGFMPCPLITLATLGDSNGLYGAMAHLIKNGYK